MKIYRHPTHSAIEAPKLDLLTFLFESEYCLAEDDTILHVLVDNVARSLTKSQLRDLTQQIAYCLRNRYSIGANGPNKDVVTVLTYGQPIAPAAFFGVITAGGVYSAASPSSTVDEVTRQLRLARSSVIICSPEVRDVASKAARQCDIPIENVLVLESDPSWSLASLQDKGTNVLVEEKRLTWQPITDERRLKESLITIVWSSGTTGAPKGVMLSHTNLVTQAYITHLPGRDAASKQIGQGTFVPYEHRTLAHLPSSHISGLFGYFISSFYGGGVVVWMRKYEWHKFLRYMKQYKITYLFTVPSIWLRISKSADVTDQFSFLAAASTGSAPMDANLQRSSSARLGNAAKDNDSLVSPTWGLSETTGAVTMTPTHQNDETGSLGPILPGLELRLVDDSFNDVQAGEPGQLLVRGPTVMNGYYNNPSATIATFHDSWFCTGDIAVQNRAGKFFMVDRKKELLKYKGLQIAPAELESLLSTHPQILEAAVIGVPSPDDPSSELPRAYVVVAADRGGRLITVEDVKSFVMERLAPYKQLRGGAVFVNEIPKNASGKILRRELRDRAKREIRDVRLSRL